MVKILFDHQMFTLQRFGGISRYFANIISNLKAKPDMAYKLGVVYSNNYYIQLEKKPLNNFFFKFVLRKTKKQIKWNNIYCKYLLKKNNFDVFHPTYFNPYFLKYLRKPFVLTVHDMIHEILPEYFSPNSLEVYHKRLLIKKADHIIAISQSTKNDIQKLYHIPDDKITVIYHGYHKIKDFDDANFNITYKKYLLYVGDRNGYKNFTRFLEAFKQISDERIDIHLICVGGGNFTPYETELIKRLNIIDFVHQTAATDGELCKLYQNALLFIYPSLYEGFGLPILEAFQNKCPIAVSNTSCFKEVCGDAVVYFNPYNVAEIKNSIELVLSSNDLPNILRNNGLIQLEKFEMDTCLKKTLEVYKKLI